jgi:hypothetical protein
MIMIPWLVWTVSTRDTEFRRLLQANDISLLTQSKIDEQVIPLNKK